MSTPSSTTPSSRTTSFSTPSSPSGRKAASNVAYEYVFVVSRHAQQTPATDRAHLSKSDPEDSGHLTETGREQIRSLGRLLKERYSSFLTGKRGEVLASHNKYHCTLESTRITLEFLNLKGVVPVLDKTDYDEIYDSNLAIHYDVIMLTLCRGQFATIGSLVDFVCKKMGFPTTSKKAKLMSLDRLIARVANGNPIPDWALPHWDDILWAERKLFELTVAGTEKQMAGYILMHMLDTLAAKYEKLLPRADKMHLFTVLSTNLFSVVKLFNSYYDGQPAFCSTLLIEVYADETEEGPQVRVLFANALKPILLRLDRLSNPCSVVDFLFHLRRILYSDDFPAPGPSVLIGPGRQDRR